MRYHENDVTPTARIREEQFWPNNLLSCTRCRKKPRGSTFSMLLATSPVRLLPCLDPIGCPWSKTLAPLLGDVLRGEKTLQLLWVVSQTAQGAHEPAISQASLLHILRWPPPHKHHKHPSTEEKAVCLVTGACGPRGCELQSSVLWSNLLKETTLCRVSQHPRSNPSICSPTFEAGG